MPYLIHLLILFCIYAILAISLNLLVGYTGLVSVSHAAFFAIGAYATAILTTVYGWNFFSALLVGIFAALFLGVLVARILSPLVWDYYVLGTVAFNYILYIVFLNWNSLTGGPLGISGIPRPKLGFVNFSDNNYFLLLAAFFAIVIYLISKHLAQSSFGRILKAIREDESAIRVFGYDTTRFKLAVFSIAAVMAALAGSLYASYVRFLDPSSGTVMISILILSMVILGGLANLRGSLLGVAILLIFPEVLRFVGFGESYAAEIRQIFYGLLLILLMRFRPQGLLGEYKL